MTSSLNRKILLTLGSLGIILVLLTFVILQQHIVSAFQNFEAKESRTNLSRVEQAINGQYQSLSAFNLEYAEWNDVYDSVNRPEIFSDFVNESIYFPEF